MRNALAKSPLNMSRRLFSAAPARRSRPCVPEVRAGGLAPILKAVVNSGSATPQLRLTSCYALAALARGNPANQAAIAKGGAVAALVKLLSAESAGGGAGAGGRGGRGSPDRGGGGGGSDEVDLREQQLAAASARPTTATAATQPTAMSGKEPRSPLAFGGVAGSQNSANMSRVPARIAASAPLSMIAPCAGTYLSKPMASTSSTDALTALASLRYLKVRERQHGR